MADAGWTVERHLSGKPPDIVALYHQFIELAQACGLFTYSVANSAITFKGARRGFAGARPGNRALSGYRDLRRRVDDPRIIRSSRYTGRLYVHQFRIVRGEFSSPKQQRLVTRVWERSAGPSASLPACDAGVSLRHRVGALFPRSSTGKGNGASPTTVGPDVPRTRPAGQL